MVQILEGVTADPGRLHEEGLTVRQQLELARASVGDFLGARPREVVFTSSATEAIVTAIWGVIDEAPGTIVTTAAEHSAVRLAAARSAPTITVGIDRTGMVDPSTVADAIDAERRAGREVRLVACQLGNHEVGTVQPIAEISRICRESEVRLLIDAAQAAGRVPFSFADVDADLVAVSGHKMGGPAGTGALLVRRRVRIPPFLVGGDQERARRAGLENTLAAVGWGAACAELADTMSAEASRARAHTDRLRTALSQIPGLDNFGPSEAASRLPHLVCAGLDDIEPQAVLLLLDQAGFAVHSGSSCASESLEPSPVLQAMGVDAERSLRFSVGWHTTDADVDALVAAVPRAIEELRSLRM